jgi:hypothetical protein
VFSLDLDFGFRFLDGIQEFGVVGFRVELFNPEGFGS